MFCRYCGKELGDNDVFCMQCGKKVYDSIVQQPAVEEIAANTSKTVVDFHNESVPHQDKPITQKESSPPNKSPQATEVDNVGMTAWIVIVSFLVLSIIAAFAPILYY